MKLKHITLLTSLFILFISGCSNSYKYKSYHLNENPEKGLEYQKLYKNQYKSHTIIYSEKKYIRVSTISRYNIENDLKEAIISTILSPSKPYGNKYLQRNYKHYKGVPYFFSNIKDNNKNDIRWINRAEKYANYLVENKIKTMKNNGFELHYIDIPFEPNDIKSLTFTNSDRKEITNIRKYVNMYSKKFNVKDSLIYAIIKTESNFYPKAINSVPAIGLMQIVPRTAGIDAYNHVYKRKMKPSKNYLFNPKNNIELGVGYINLLDTKYLKKIKDKKIRKLCVIASYNTGHGNVMRKFNRNSRKKAFEIVNRMSYDEVYRLLKRKLPNETKRYIDKVLTFEKLYL